VGIKHLYFGLDSFERYPDEDVHPFFLNSVTSWTVEAFLGQYPSDFQRFKVIESGKRAARSIRTFCFKQLQFLASVEGLTHVNVVQAQSPTSQNTILIKENCLDEFQRNIIVGQGTKLGAVHLNTTHTGLEAPSRKLPHWQETGNAGQSEADDSNAGKRPDFSLSQSQFK